MTELVVEQTGAIAWLRISNAARMNPLTAGLTRELRAALRALRDQPQVRVVVLTGSGRAFCVGADLSGMEGGSQDGRSLGDRTGDVMEEETNRLVLEIRQFPAPVVCALNGVAAGAGVGLALAADIVVACRSAYFYLSFMPRLGIVPDTGTVWFLQRMAGHARAMGMALLGDKLTAEEARDWGLIWRCVEDTELQATVEALAARLAAAPAHAAPELRRAFEHADQATLDAQLGYEAERQRDLIDRPEFLEGVMAFKERREPVFPPR
jgi:2-(1,2-epoxy-1,2-dihydrophenyl)acetyl-CoA isomerase